MSLTLESALIGGVEPALSVRCYVRPRNYTFRISMVSIAEHTSKKGGWCPLFYWYTGLLSSRTQTKHTFPVRIRRPDLSKLKPESKKYRNPVIYAQKLHDEMVRDNLTRKQLSEKHGVSSDRITQWLCLLKLPEEKLRKIEALGDYWERQIVTARELRNNRRCYSSFSSITPLLESSEDNLAE